jgi:uncharacterized protein YaiE (UPF0345 family)
MVLNCQEEIYKKKQEAVEILQQSISRTSKGLLFSEVDRFNTERAENIRVLVGSVVSANVSIALRTTAKWQDISRDGGINMPEFESFSNAMYNATDEAVVFSDA